MTHQQYKYYTLNKHFKIIFLFNDVLFNIKVVNFQFTLSFLFYTILKNIFLVKA